MAKARSHIQTRATAPDSFLPALLQRRCACDGTIDEGRRSFGEVQLGHDFSKVRVHEENLDWQQEPSDDTAIPTDGGQQEPATHAGVTTGGTGCSTSSGSTYVVVKNKDECTKDCSGSHEQKHSTDIAPCCTKAGEAAAKTDKQEEKDNIQNKFDKWMTDNVNYFECRAYGVSVTCGEAKLKKMNCPTWTQKCCTPVTHYVRSSKMQKEGTCNNAGEKLTDCPF